MWVASLQVIQLDSFTLACICFFYNSCDYMTNNYIEDSAISSYTDVI